jgi:hypothetical protein
MTEETKTPFKAGETYRTRDGREAVVEKIRLGDRYPVKGRVSDKAECWTLDGTYQLYFGPYALDLLPPVPEPVASPPREIDVASWEAVVLALKERRLFTAAEVVAAVMDDLKPPSPAPKPLKGER